MNRNLILFGLIFAVIAIIAFFAFSNVRARTVRTAEIKGNTIQLELASTREEQQKGLSGRESLAQDRGMLFVFNRAENHSFWMKDMRFPIDIIFLNNNRVVTIYNNVQPKLQGSNTQNLRLYPATEPANRVIEVNAGLAQKWGLKTGDTIAVNL